MTRPPRSWLYVPAHDEKKVAKSATLGADAVILDLEDGTPQAHKVAAREVARNALDRAGKGSSRYWVRINAVEEDDAWRADLAAVAGSRALAGIVVPKTSRAEQLERVHSELVALAADAPLAAIVTETVDAALSIGATLAADAPVEYAFWGTEDLQSDLGASSIRDETGGLLGAYAVVEGLFLLEASRARVAAVDTPTLDIEDLDKVRRESERAAQFGYSGRQVIHPSHIEIVNQAFTPSARRVEHATAVVNAFGGDPGGAYRVDGGMVDAPHLRSALRILDQATIYGVRTSG